MCFFSRPLSLPDRKLIIDALISVNVGDYRPSNSFHCLQRGPNQICINPCLSTKQHFERRWGGGRKREQHQFQRVYANDGSVVIVCPGCYKFHRLSHRASPGSQPRLSRDTRPVSPGSRSRLYAGLHRGSTGVSPGLDRGSGVVSTGALPRLSRGLSAVPARSLPALNRVSTGSQPGLNRVSTGSQLGLNWVSPRVCTGFWVSILSVF